MNYDIIGDIHGHADALKALLVDMGYRNTQGAWRHRDRQAIFVGDFVDRGPQQVETVDVVRRMVDADSARAVMGNHEFNAIAWFLPDPELPGEYLRQRHSAKYGDKNFRQHEAFLREVNGTPNHQEIINWFLSLPLWLDLGEIRVVHACWHQGYMDKLRDHLDDKQRLNKDLVVAASRQPADSRDKDNADFSVFKAVEAVTKGIEVPLPAGKKFRDKDGHERDRVRVRWWDDTALTYSQSALLSDEERVGLPRDPIPIHARIGYDGGTPLFIGHYWLNGVPCLWSSKVACVDYSIAKGGKLVAYRWDDGDPVLLASKFHWVGK